MRLIAYLTHAEKPEITPDDALALPELKKLGIEVRPQVWDDPAARWDAYSAIIVRSPWDYWKKPEAFAAWISKREAAGARVLNPLSVLRWNLNKRYLMELYEKGVAIPKSVWLKRGTRVVIGDWLESKGIHHAVVKPAVSAGGVDTVRVGASEVQALLDQWLPDRDLLVQEFAPAIETEGEVSLIYFGGEFSHAGIKRPRAGEFRIQESHGGRHEAFQADPTWIARGREILKLAPESVLYARVDCVAGPDGKPLLMELEVFEPALYLWMDPEAPARFARAILQAL